MKKDYRRNIKRVICTVALTLFATAASSFSQTLISGTTGNTTITLPSSGYCKLMGDIKYTGAARAMLIPADASDLTIDLNGFTISSTTGAASHGVGHSSTTTGSNVVLKNGVIRGFIHGVIIGGSAYSGGGHVVDNLRVIGGEGADRRAGVRTYGEGCIVKNTIVSDIYSENPITHVIGIVVHGPESLVTNCDVRNVRTSGTTTYKGWGINFPGSSVNSLGVENRIFNSDVGIHAPTPSVKLRDNLTSSSVNLPFNGGIDVSGND